MDYVGGPSRGIMLLRIVLWCCLLFLLTPGVLTPGARASIIRRRGYIPADGAPVANYVGELSRGIA